MNHPMIKPAELHHFLLLDPPADFSLDTTIQMVLSLSLSGFVFNGVIVRRELYDTPATLENRYHAGFARLYRDPVSKPDIKLEDFYHEQAQESAR